MSHASSPHRHEHGRGRTRPSAGRFIPVPDAVIEHWPHGRGPRYVVYVGDRFVATAESHEEAQRIARKHGATTWRNLSHP